MANKVSFTQTKADIEKKLMDMVSKAGNASSYINRVIYRQYQNAQLERWKTENASEGTQWKPLNKQYEAWKKRAYKGGIKYKWYGGRGVGNTGYDENGEPRPWVPIGTWPVAPGGGEKLMIATGRLVGSVVGPNDEYPLGTRDHRKEVTAHSISVFTTVEYASEAAKDRPFMTFGRQTIDDMRAGFKKYVMGTF